jgi:hypothetical protein
MLFILPWLWGALTSDVQDCVETGPDADDDMDFFSIEVVSNTFSIR